MNGKIEITEDFRADAVAQADVLEAHKLGRPAGIIRAEGRFLNVWMCVTRDFDHSFTCL